MKRLAFLLLLASPLHADTPAEAAASAAEQLRSAEFKMAEAPGARDRVRALTETVRAYENGLIAMRDGLRRAAIEEDTISLSLEANRDKVGALLSALQSMSKLRGPTLLMHPDGPQSTIHASILAAGMTPALEAEADSLRDQLFTLSELRQLQQSATNTLQDGLQGAQAARAALTLAVSQRSTLPKRFTDDPVQTALLVASTETLDAFAEGLTNSFLSNQPVNDVTIDKGTLALPVNGEVISDFDNAQAGRQGIIISAPARALVTTPVGATVLFRGPLLDYGNVIILEPGANILFVIGGLAEVYGETGDILPAGSPIGLMGADQPNVNRILRQSALSNIQDGQQPLYLEVREGQSSVNPAQWFALNTE